MCRTGFSIVLLTKRGRYQRILRHPQGQAHGLHVHHRRGCTIDHRQTGTEKLGILYGLSIFLLCLSDQAFQGAFSFACPNRSRTFDAPIPTNISTNSDPDIEKKGTFASPATAFASMVFPVPGGPTSRIPLSIEAPISLYFPGSSIRPVLYTQFSSLSVKRIRLF